MSDLVTWFRAQLDDEEAIANVISDGGYMPQQWRHGSDSGDVGVLLYADDRMIGDPPDAIEEADAPFAIVINNRAEHRHIVRWDPARVLAEVDAKRRILDLHAPLMDHRGRAICEYCAGLCHSRSGLGCDDPDAPYPCDTIRLLALPFAGRPGYDESWRPA